MPDIRLSKKEVAIPSPSRSIRVLGLDAGPAVQGPTELKVGAGCAWPPLGVIKSYGQYAQVPSES
jgi:hypothetical protein